MKVVDSVCSALGAVWKWFKRLGSGDVQDNVPNQPPSREVPLANPIRQTEIREVNEPPSTLGAIMGGGLGGSSTVTTGRTHREQTPAAPFLNTLVMPFPQDELTYCCGHRLEDGLCHACGKCFCSNLKIILTIIALAIVVGASISELVILYVYTFKNKRGNQNLL